MKRRILLLTIAAMAIFALSLSACGGKETVEYSVTFDYNYEGAAVTVLKTQGGKVRFVGDPERENYEFKGWYLERECLTPFTAQSVNKDTILYAKWQEKEEISEPDVYTVTFSLNGGDGVLPDSQSVKAGGSFVLPSGDGITRDGYLFDGWTSGGKTYAAGESVRIDGNTEFAANWAAATTVIFDLNGGTGTPPQSMTVKSGSEISLPSGDGLTRDGYTFDGWLDDANELCHAPYGVSAATVTLRAAWAGRYTLTLVANGSSKQISVETGASTQLEAVAAEAGKTFVGWQDEAGRMYGEGESFVCAYQDVTLTAVFEDSFVITYSDWDGTVLKTVSYMEGEDITAPDLFITHYAEFAGWDRDPSTLTESATVTAKYNYTFTDMRYFDLDFSGSYSARYGGYFIRFSDLSAALPPLTEVKFPITWKGSPIIGVYSSGSAPKNSQFYGNITLEKVYIPSSFKLLPVYAFYDCTALSEVKFSETCNVTQIGMNAFNGCTSLTTFTLPSSVTTLVTSAYGGSYTADNVGTGSQFSGCTSLEEFIFEEGSRLTKLAGHMFSECPALERIVNLPEGVTVLPFSLFRNCTSLKTFTVPERITTLGGWVFDGCKALKEIVFEGDNVATIGEYAFCNTAITELDLPSKVAYIPHCMAYGCKELVSVTLGDRVETIDYEAFGGCVKLSRFNSDENGVFVMPESLRHIGAGAFMYAAAMRSIELNEGLLSIGDGAFAAYYRYTDKTNESVGLTEITIPASVTSFGEGVFDADRYLQSITILSENIDFETHDGIMYRKSTGTLAYCPLGKVAEELTIRDGTVGVEDFALASTTGIKKVICPESLREIGTGSFQLSNIEAVEFNDGLETIGEASFYLLDKLTALYIPASVMRIEKDAFKGCSELATLEFAAGSRLSYFGTESFYMTGIGKVEIPASVTEMDMGVFQACKNLKTVTFGEGSALEYIAQNTFNATGLESIELPSSVKELHYNSLSYNNLTSIDLKNVTSVGQQVFTGTKLSSLYIPSTVTEIGVHSFSNIATLESVIFAEDSRIAVINNFAFYNDVMLKELTLPASVTNINMGAFSGLALDKLTLTSPMVVGVAESAFAEGAVKQLIVPQNLITNYKNHEIWSKVGVEIVASTAKIN